MNKLLIALTALVLTSCSPEAAEEITMDTVERGIQTMEAAVEATRAYAPYVYVEDWTECSIEGVIYEDVSFGYSTIGLYFVVDGVATYVPDLPYKIDYCIGEVIEWQPEIIIE